MYQTFSYWMRSNLKDAYGGLITQDIDLVIIDEAKKSFFFIEEKKYSSARIGPAQKVIFNMFDEFLKTLNTYKFLGTIILVTTGINISSLDDLFKELKKAQKISKQKYTIDSETFKKLWDCKGSPRVKKTEPERTGRRESYLEKFINSNSSLFIDKIDWIFVNYCTGYFIFIEECLRNKEIPPSKKNFIKMIDSFFLEANNLNLGKVKNPKSNATYKYLGYYELRFSNTNPDNSDIITLNGKQVKKDDLIEVLNLESDKIRSFRNIEDEE